MNCILKQQQIHFVGAGWILNDRAGKTEGNFHTKQILGTLTGFNILGWLVKIVSLLKSGGSLLINPKTLKDVSPQCHKGLLLVRKPLAEKGVVKPSLKGYTLVESKKRKKKIPLNTIV